MRRSAEELACADPRGHLLGLRAIHAAVLELDHGIDPLAAEAFELVALAAANGSLHDLVVDARVVERLLDLPAGMWRDLEPLVAAAMKLDGHQQADSRVAPGGRHRVV